MFDEILNLVKSHLGSNPAVANSIPADQADDIHNEVATHINNGLQQQVNTQDGIGGMLSSLENAAASGGPVTNAIEGGLVGSLASKFGLSPAITGAIAAALPGILQKFAHKANDPNDNSITTQGLGSAFGF
ncbi:DUF937 domain-containing protein [Mucilaginibacter ginkgonis]|uniref:DUF937 domain-containing protein n=1 Tax=Mucilaginibacter ginkgonis TaxID=2682091 RepID=A0A6I4HWT7_9SPHI|nr:DUF937 domain-containing protein [Mucilaginibacter ginkgonis]QQL49947.1 hypothetical protein GO620_000410 [Mucilaginibacter ginkgonis]